MPPTSPPDVHQSIIGMVSDDAIGRKNYSDRGGRTAAEEDSEEGVEQLAAPASKTKFASSPGRPIRSNDS